jgi:trans-2,3-dihydro-3-hydroxyanthranilate isomerase
MQRRFATLDVFTNRRFAGNPLAVVLDAGGLDTAAMQSIAREFNHPETVFVLPPEDKAHRARLRIFTPARELPFAGHPTVGTAVLLALQDRSTPGREMVLEENIGPVRCVLEAGEDEGAGERGRVRFTIPQLPAEAGIVPGDTVIAAALQLAPADIGFDRHRPSRWSAGNAFTFVPVAGLAAMARAWPDPMTFDAVFGSAGVVAAAFLFCAESAEPGHDFHARMFAPGMGLVEDPATGSAAAAFAGVLAQFVPGDGSHAFAIEQGYEMGRPSLIHLAITQRDGKLAAASIGGDAVIVTQGTIEA